jgi:hypothetical protein
MNNTAIASNIKQESRQTDKTDEADIVVDKQTEAEQA